MSDAPVRVTLDAELSAAVRYLAEHLTPGPSMTGIVEHAVRELIERHAGHHDTYHKPFRDLVQQQRAHLKVLP